MPQNNIEVVEQVYTRALAGDIDGLRPLFDEDVCVVEAESLPYRGEYRGFENMLGLLEKVADCWGEGYSADLERFIGQDEWVVALLKIKGTNKVTGQAVSMPLCEVWEFRNGKVVSVRPFYWDTKAVSQMQGD